MAKDDAAAKKRSQAAKKAAATRARKAQEVSQPEGSVQETQTQDDPQDAALESIGRSSGPTEAQRDADREAELRRHNERTGGGPIREGEIKAAREKHNERANIDGF